MCTSIIAQLDSCHLLNFQFWLITIWLYYYVCSFLSVMIKLAKIDKLENNQQFKKDFIKLKVRTPEMALIMLKQEVSL